MKISAENHRILVEVYGEYALTERTCQEYFNVDFGLEDEERLDGQRSLKMRNKKHYLIKIVAKQKKSSQNLSRSLKQPFQNIPKQPKTLKRKEIRCHMDWSQETLKDDIACQKCCLNTVKRSRFSTGLWLEKNNGYENSKYKKSYWNLAIYGKRRIFMMPR